MRSADRFMPCSALVAALCLTGCASLFDSRAEEVSAPAPVAAPAAPSKATVAAVPNAPAASVPVLKPPEPEVAVTPAAQRAFDDARRAMRSGRMDEAERGFKSLIQFHPELGGPHANLGVIYRQAGKLPESAAELELATKASPVAS
jgi:hypothetical protein